MKAITHKSLRNTQLPFEDDEFLNTKITAIKNSYEQTKVITSKMC